MIGPDERDARADTDTGLYYCVTDGIVSRDARPLYATLAEWRDLAKAIRGEVYIPVGGGRRTEPLFGSLPLINTTGAPDIVGQLLGVLSYLESTARVLAARAEHLDRLRTQREDG